MLLYRQSLLDEILDLPPEETGAPHPGDLALKCVESAVAMARLAHDLFKAKASAPVFWVRVLPSALEFRPGTLLD
jgi:hypothetical protein